MLAKNIREARRRAELTQGELGKKLGVAHSTVAGYESGNAIPSTDKLSKIAEITGWNMETLLGKIAFPDGEIDARTNEEKNHDSAISMIKRQIGLLESQQNTIEKQADTIAKLVEIVGSTTK